MVMRVPSSYFLGFIALVCLLLTSCGTEVPFPRCVSADNFNGNTTVSVSAYYGEGNVDAFRADDGALGNGSTPGSTKQVVRWKDTGLVTDGEEIVVKIEGAWVPWEKNGNKKSSPVAVNTGISRPADPADEFYDAVVDVDRVCGPLEKTQSTAGTCGKECFHIPAADDESKGQYGKPCWLEKGYGAYLLFQRPIDENPNATLDTIEYPRAPTTHLGYASADQGGKASYSSEGRIYDADCKSVNPERGWKIYVKILDNYYHDNSGGYSLEFTKGVIQGNRTDVFEHVRKLVRAELDKAGQQIFQRITNNAAFKNFMLALITLFLVLSVLAYIFGMVRAPLPDIVVRVLKIVLVILLISPNSWDFFYNHLLQLFIKGVDEIIALINSYAIGQNFKASEPFAFMDIMIRDRIFSPVVWEAKARALITADKVSLFALLIIIIAVLVYIGLCLYGFIIYLTAFLGITFLISLMPILFAGILFSRFRSLFDGWLTQCISFSMQAILMFTLIAMFGSLIMHYYYRIFGFSACYNEWIHAKIYALGIRIIDQKYYEWTPGQKYEPIVLRISGVDSRRDSDKGMARYKFTGGGSVIRVPPDYKDEDFRFVDLPFLDPDTSSKTVPGGVALKENADKYRTLATLTNSLVAAERQTGIARLVTRIEREYEELEKNGSITEDNKKAFTAILQDAKYGDPKKAERWKNKELKAALIKNVLDNVLNSHAAPATPVKDLEQQYDYAIIKSIRQGYMVMWPEVFGLILVAFLVWQMRAFVQNIAVVLSGGGMMSRTMASMYEEGFTRIFSGIPVIGRAVEFVDQGIDSIRLVARAKIEGVASAITKAPERILSRVPIVGGAMESVLKGVRSTANFATSAHKEEDIYSMRSLSPNFDYATAWLGAHLGFSPLDALKYMGKYALTPYTGGLMHNMRQDRAALLSNLRTLTKGVDKYSPSPYVPEKKDEDDDHNPFAQKTVPGTENTFGSDDGRPDQGGRGRIQNLHDDDGNLRINRGNFTNAISALQGLTAMSRNNPDPAARELVDRDIQRLRNAIGGMGRERPGEVQRLQRFYREDGRIDFDALIREVSREREQSADSDSQREELESASRDVASTSLLTDSVIMEEGFVVGGVPEQDLGAAPPADMLHESSRSASSEAEQEASSEEFSRVHYLDEKVPDVQSTDGLFHEAGESSESKDDADKEQEASSEEFSRRRDLDENVPEEQSTDGLSNDVGESSKSKDDTDKAHEEASSEELSRKHYLDEKVPEGQSTDGSSNDTGESSKSKDDTDKEQEAPSEEFSHRHDLDENVPEEQSTDGLSNDTGESYKSKDDTEREAEGSSEGLAYPHSLDEGVAEGQSTDGLSNDTEESSESKDGTEKVSEEFDNLFMTETGGEEFENYDGLSNDTGESSESKDDTEREAEGSSEGLAYPHSLDEGVAEGQSTDGLSNDTEESSESKDGTEKVSEEFDDLFMTETGGEELEDYCDGFANLFGEEEEPASAPEDAAEDAAEDTAEEESGDYGGFDNLLDVEYSDVMPEGDDIEAPDDLEVEDYCDGFTNLFGEEGDQDDDETTRELEDSSDQFSNLLDEQDDEEKNKKAIDMVEESKSDTISNVVEEKVDTGVFSEKAVRKLKAKESKGSGKEETKKGAKQGKGDDVEKADGKLATELDKVKEGIKGHIKGGKGKSTTTTKGGKYKDSSLKKTDKKEKTDKHSGLYAKLGVVAPVGKVVKDTLSKEVGDRISTMFKKLGFASNTLKEKQIKGSFSSGKDYLEQVVMIENQVAEYKELITRKDLDKEAAHSILKEIEKLEAKLKKLTDGEK